MSGSNREETADKLQMRNVLLKRGKEVLVEFLKNASITEDKERLWGNVPCGCPKHTWQLHAVSASRWACADKILEELASWNKDGNLD